MGTIKPVDVDSINYNPPTPSSSSANNNVDSIITPEYEQMMLLSGDVEQMELAANSVSAGSNIEAAVEIQSAVQNNITELLSIRTFDDLQEYISHNIATLQTHINSAREAVMKLLENMGDGITGAFAASSAAQLESYGVLDPNDRESTLQEVAEGIAVDHTKEYWDNYWNSDEGKTIDANSYLKHDGIFNEGIKGATTIIGYIAMSITPPGWLASAASVAGESYESTIQNGGTLNDAYVNAAPAVAIDGLLNIVGGKTVGQVLRNAAAPIKNSVKTAYEEAINAAKNFEFPKLGDVASKAGATAIDIPSTIWNKLADEHGFLNLGGLFGKGKKADKVTDVGQINHYTSIADCDYRIIQDADTFANYFFRNQNGTFSDFEKGELEFFKRDFDIIINTQEYMNWVNTRNPSQYSQLFEFIYYNYNKMDNTIISMEKAAAEVKWKDFSPETRKWYESLNDYEKNTISDYTTGNGNLISGGSYDAINPYLRSGENAISKINYKVYGYSSFDEFISNLDRRIAIIDNVIKKAPKLADDTVVYRYVNIDALKVDSLDDINKLLGTDYKDNGFMSSVMEKVGYPGAEHCQIEMEILLPKGTPLAEISLMNKYGEMEVMFPRNIDFTISDVVLKDDGQFTVRLIPKNKQVQSVSEKLAEVRKLQKQNPNSSEIVRLEKELLDDSGLTEAFRMLDQWGLERGAANYTDTIINTYDNKGWEAVVNHITNNKNGIIHPRDLFSHYSASELKQLRQLEKLRNGVTGREVQLKKALNNMENFFELDVEVKTLLSKLAHGENKVDVNLIDYSDRLWKALPRVESRLKRICEIYNIDSDVVETIEKCFKNYEGIIANAKYTDEGLRQVYNECYGKINQDTLDLIHDKLKGDTYWDSSVLKSIIHEDMSANEILHALHSYIINNKPIMDSIEDISSHTLSNVKDVISLKGEQNKLANEMYQKLIATNEAIPKELSSICVGSTDIISVSSDKIIIMVRDKGHCLTIECNLQANGQWGVSYFIPKTISEDKVIKLKGITGYHRGDEYASGSFVTDAEDLADDITKLINDMPTDSHIMYEGKKEIPPTVSEYLENAKKGKSK